MSWISFGLRSCWVRHNVYSLNRVVTCPGVRMMNNNGSRSDDWIYCPFFVQSLLITNHTTLIADLHTFQFTAANALGFSVAISRILATDLKTETTTPNNYEVFLPIPKTRPSSLLAGHSTGTQLPDLQSKLLATGSLYSFGSDPMESTPRVIKNACLLVLWLAMVIFITLSYACCWLQWSAPKCPLTEWILVVWEIHMKERSKKGERSKLGDNRGKKWEYGRNEEKERMYELVS
jgi:hypothetical protein